MQSDAEGVPSFYWIQEAQKAKRVYVGGYTGIFRSDDEGDTWTKIDTLLPFIFSITAGAPRSKGATHSVSVSTYGAGVFQTEVAIKGGKATLISDKKNDRSIPGEMTRLPIIRAVGKKTAIASRYLLLEYSPNFAKDGLLMVNSQKVGTKRSTDGGKTFEDIRLPPQDPDALGLTVHAFAFSPNFATDNTILLSGYNLGVVKSLDGGETFTRMPFPGTFKLLGTYIKISLCADYEEGKVGKQTILAHYRSDSDQTKVGSAARALLGQCSKNTACGWMDAYATGSTLALSRNGGTTWKVIGTMSAWKDATMVGDQVWAYKTAPSPAMLAPGAYPPASDIFKYELFVLGDGDSEFVQVPLSGNLGPNGFAKPSGDHVVLSYLDGGIIAGKADLAAKKISETSRDDAKMLFRQTLITQTSGGEMPRFVQTLLPSDDHERGLGRLVVHSANFSEDSVLFGARGFDILYSTDKGATWATMYTMNHTISQGIPAVLEGCALARNSEEAPEKHGPNNVPSQFQASGAFCVECESGYIRNVEGATCSRTAEVLMVGHDVFGSHEHVNTEDRLSNPELYKPRKSALELEDPDAKEAPRTANPSVVLLQTGVSQGRASSPLAEHLSPRSYVLIGAVILAAFSMGMAWERRAMRKLLRAQQMAASEQTSLISA